MLLELRMDWDFDSRPRRPAFGLLLKERDGLLLPEINVRPFEPRQISEAATRVVTGQDQPLPVSFGVSDKFRDLFGRERPFLEFISVPNCPDGRHRVPASNALIDRNL